MPFEKLTSNIIESPERETLYFQHPFVEKVNAKKQTLEQEPDRFIKQTNSFFMFWSKGRLGVNINGKFKSEDDKKIYCRHLAAAQLFHNTAVVGQTYHEAFENPNEVPFLQENIFDKAKFIAGASAYYLLNIKNIGDELAQLARHLTDNTALRILFTSVNHMMSIKIKHEGEKGFTVQFYDPNYTLIHKQIYFPNADSINSLTLQDLIGPQDIELYFPRHNAAFAIYPTEESVHSLHALSTYNIGVNTSVEDRLHFGFRFEADCWVSDAVQTILGSDLEEAKKVELLLSKATSDVPRLFLALQRGHTNIVKTYINLILNSNLTEENKAKLLACENGKHIPGLFLALQNGQVQTISTYVKEIIASNLMDERKESLLIGTRHSDGAPAIYAALLGGQDAAVACYLRELYQLPADSLSRCLLRLMWSVDKVKQDMLLQAIYKHAPEIFDKVGKNNNPCLRILWQEALKDDADIPSIELANTGLPFKPGA